MPSSTKTAVSIKKSNSTEGKWVAILQEFAQSNLGVHEFCKAKGIGYSTFMKRKRQLGGVAPQTSFVPIKVQAGGDVNQQTLITQSSSLTLHINDELSLSIPEGFHAATLKRVIHVLATTSSI